MRLNKLHTDVAATVLNRSVCNVMVGACLADKDGIYAVGWNSSGPTGFGLHAEIHCLLRSNRKRLAKSTLYVAAIRKKSGSVVTAKPCDICQRMVRKVGKIAYRNKRGEWLTL